MKCKVISEKDNVAVLLESEGKIPAGHKIALKDIAEGEEIIKYSHRIGRATQTIRKGEWVHSHNMKTALDETLKATSQMYVLYDDVGKLTLKNIGSMKLGLLIDEDTAGDFDYKSSIASQTYDKIKLSYENKDTGKREIFVAQDSSNINQWGVLQYYEKLDSTTNAKAMADALLSLYNTKTRTLKLQDVLGDIRVRAGTLLVVMLGLGDINVSNYLMVEQVKHTFNNEQHLMELKMRGGTFVT